MAGPFHFDPEALPTWLTGVVCLLVAVWLWILNRRSQTINPRASRALVLLLFFLAGDFLCFAFGSAANSANQPYVAEQWFRAEARFLFMIDLAALYFLLVYPRPRTWFGRTPWGAVILVGVGAIMQLFMLLDPAMTGEFVIDDQGRLQRVHAGHLHIITIVPTFTIIGLVFVRDYWRGSQGPRRAGYLLAAAGFLARNTWVGAHGLTIEGLRFSGWTVPPFPATLGGAAARLFDYAAAVAALGAAALLLGAVRGRIQDRAGVAEARRFLWAVVAFFVLGIITATVRTLLAPSGSWLSRVSDNLLILLIPALLAYAMVRHRLLGIEMKLRWTVKSGTLAAIFLVVFFVVASVAQSFLQDRLSWILGGVATGVLVFLLAPLQRFAERVATAAMPTAKPLERMTVDDRSALYRDLVRSAWEDGMLTLPERRVLETAQRRLGITPDRAQRLEGEALAEATTTDLRRKPV